MAETFLDKLIRGSTSAILWEKQSGFRDEKAIIDGPIEVYFGSAVSAPMDWWHGIHFLNSLAGHYGKIRQAKAVNDLRSIRSLVAEVGRGAPEVVKLLSVLLRYAVQNSETGIEAVDVVFKKIDRDKLLRNLNRLVLKKAGRHHGKMFTVYAASGGARGLRKLGKSRKKAKVGHNTLIMIGTLWRYVIMTKQRHAVRTYLDAYFLLTSGEWDHDIGNREQFDLITALKGVNIIPDKNIQSSMKQELASTQMLLLKLKLLSQ